MCHWRHLLPPPNGKSDMYCTHGIISIIKAGLKGLSTTESTDDTVYVTLWRQGSCYVKPETRQLFKTKTSFLSKRAFSKQCNIIPCYKYMLSIMLPYNICLFVSPWYLNTVPDKAINKLTDRCQQTRRKGDKTISKKLMWGSVCVSHWTEMKVMERVLRLV